MQFHEQAIQYECFTFQLFHDFIDFDKCTLGKQHKEHVLKASVIRTIKKLQLIHSNLCGPFIHASLERSKLFISNFLKKTLIFFLRIKNVTFNKFEAFNQMVENVKKKNIKVSRIN
jgi:2-hydroxy-3-keto-5-methylthiopentenyl-1-phosphate phosphatase